ncbi:hypothetical protein PMO31116_02530 [Pandoraea morbifera]|uniref:Uncharacterized protein n=1 Tax=Pandoraea morbifera TaxID=2508300 RepID=A0A5E4VCK8_9BURK|nr:hypothetical protein PMO31116_02530 [Pandoraea morbifera]
MSVFSSRPTSGSPSPVLTSVASTDPARTATVATLPSAVDMAREFVGARVGDVAASVVARGPRDPRRPMSGEAPVQGEGGMRVGPSNEPVPSLSAESRGMAANDKGLRVRFATHLTYVSISEPRRRGPADADVE